MRAIEIAAFGGPEGLRAVDVPSPQPRAGEVLLKVEATGLGYVDVLIRSGSLAAYGFKVGHVLGNEVAGTVVALGEGVDASWKGRRVLASLGERGGGYAELAVAGVAAAVPIPDALRAPEAVCLVNAVVARYSLERAGLKRGERLLVRGAAGGIGLMTAQLAAAGGITVAATTSSAERGARLREYGVTELLDRSGGAGGAKPAPFDAIVDIVAGPRLASFFELLAPGGRFVVVGIVGGPPKPDFAMPMFTAFQKSMVFSTMSLNIYELAERAKVLRELIVQATNGALKPVVHGVVSLADAVAAHRTLESGEVFGKLVLVP